MNAPPIRGILFDLDETLHSRETAFWAWLDTEARNQGVVLERGPISELDARGRGDKAKLLAHLSHVFRWQELEHEERMERFRAGLSAHVRLEPGVRDLLVRLKQKYRLGVITNGSGATQRAKLSSLGIHSFFEPLVISGEVGARKPEGRIFEIALASWEIPPASVLFVGDDPISDIQGATALGMRALRVGEGGISSILQLEQWLSEHA
jgi:putative hydrolase of the HAD superfamily